MTITAVTKLLNTSDFELLDHLPQNPMAYLRNGEGLVGFGELLTLTASGANRIQDLAESWRAVVTQSSIVDDLALPGTGLIAFGAIAFSDQSAVASKLIIPKVILGSRDGRVWITKLTDSAGEVDVEDYADFWTRPTAVGPAHSINLIEGEVSAERFEAIVNQALKSIETGAVEKVVLARDLRGQVPENFDVRGALRRLAKRFPTCWVYSVAGNFGASPELLVRVSHGQVSARVLAGTAGRGTDPGVDQAIATALANSEKNLREHAFAVESLVNALAAVCERVDADEKPFSLPLPNLWHLATDVHAVLKQDASVLDVAALLHPTAAVAGTPRAAAQEIIEQLEHVDRGYYAGPVGWLGADGDGEWAIALRGAQLNNDELVAFAGCGIVTESDAEAEFAETELKFSPIRGALA